MSELKRFLEAQAPVIEQVLHELRSGRKRSHWMWFVFPQIAGLGQSPTARTYAIADLSEAQSYLAHPVLGARLKHCAKLVNDIAGRSAYDIFSTPDDLKFCSSMTLFSLAAPDEPLFAEALQKYFANRPDPLTFALLGQTPPG